MSLKQTLELELREALKNKQEIRKQTIRMVLSNIKLAEIDQGSPLDDQRIIALLHKEVKLRNEALENAKAANRADLIEANQKEIEVIESFLPKALTEDEIQTIAQEVIRELNASSPADMGKVMKATLAKVEGRAAGNVVSQVVRRLLQP